MTFDKPSRANVNKQLVLWKKTKTKKVKCQRSYINIQPVSFCLYIYIIFFTSRKHGVTRQIGHHDNTQHPGGSGPLKRYSSDKREATGMFAGVRVVHLKRCYCYRYCYCYPTESMADLRLRYGLHLSRVLQYMCKIYRDGCCDRSNRRGLGEAGEEVREETRGGLGGDAREQERPLKSFLPRRHTNLHMPRR